MSFPLGFIERLQDIVPFSHKKIIKGFAKKKFTGLRLNPLKISVEKLRQLIDDPSLTSISFIQNGYKTLHKERYTKNPLMYSGAYYVQDLGSMLIVESMGIQPTDQILDACASPGSKSTHILSFLKMPGFLIANEVTHNRVGRLLENIGLWGQSNILICSQKTEVFQSLPQFFDKILVDAPCSGEGMFGKSGESQEQWSEGLIKKCAIRQKEILRHVLPSLKKNGELLYSTCTLAPEENEEIVQWLLKEYPNLTLIPLEVNLSTGEGFEKGLEKFRDHLYRSDIAQFTRRILPYHSEFEAQSFFMARFQLKKEIQTDISWKKNKSPRYSSLQSFPTRIIQDYIDKMSLNISIQDLIVLGHYLYYKGGWNLQILKELVAFLHPVYLGARCGILKKDRVEPTWEIATIAQPLISVQKILPLKIDDLSIYLSGSPLLLIVDNRILQKGFVIVSFQGFLLGVAKITDTEIKSYFYSPFWKKMS